LSQRNTGIPLQSRCHTEKDASQGEHRTEAMEVTEGILRLDSERVTGGQLGFWAGLVHF
jgi:hypothetical protein